MGEGRGTCGSFLPLSPAQALGEEWDAAVYECSELYRKRMVRSMPVHTCRALAGGPFSHRAHAARSQGANRHGL